MLNEGKESQFGHGGELMERHLSNPHSDLKLCGSVGELVKLSPGKREGKVASHDGSAAVKGQLRSLNRAPAPSSR